MAIMIAIYFYAVYFRQYFLIVGVALDVGSRIK